MRFLPETRVHRSGSRSLRLNPRPALQCALPALALWHVLPHALWRSARSALCGPRFRTVCHHSSATHWRAPGRASRALERAPQFRSALPALRSALPALQSAHVALRSALHALRDMLSMPRSALPARRSVVFAFQSVPPALWSSLPALTSLLHELRSALAALRNALSALRSASPLLQDALPAFQSALSALASAVPALQIELFALHNALPNLQNALPTLNDALRAPERPARAPERAAYAPERARRLPERLLPHTSPGARRVRPCATSAIKPSATAPPQRVSRTLEIAGHTLECAAALQTALHNALAALRSVPPTLQSALPALRSASPAPQNALPALQSAIRSKARSGRFRRPIYPRSGELCSLSGARLLALQSAPPSAFPRCPAPPCASPRLPAPPRATERVYLAAERAANAPQCAPLLWNALPGLQIAACIPERSPRAPERAARAHGKWRRRIAPNPSARP